MKKSLGQHFLRSERALRAIVEAGEVNSEDKVLEIGPGQGVLTEKLLETGAEIIAIEKDDNLFEFLKQKFEKEIGNGKLELIHDDILNFQTSNLQTYKLIANIPYNITGAILKKFLESEHQPQLMILLVQKEVAKRVVAQDKKESILSISVKVYGTPRYIETVKAGSFVPRPKVDSAIIAIENISKDFFLPAQAGKDFSEKKFFEIIHAGFKSKRKKLSSNLSTIQYGGNASVKKIREIFKKLNLDDNLRAEDINIETWRKLAQNLI